MRFLFLAWIVGAAVFGLYTVAVDWAQIAELAARAEAEAAAKEAERQAALEAQRQAEEKRQKEARERKEKEKLAAEARLREEQAKLAAEQEELRRKQIEDQCDRTAGNTFDRYRNQSFAGVSYEILRLNAPVAVAKCRDAVAASPDNPRLRYQLARALQAQKDPAAKVLLTELVQSNYPIAYDNLGWWYYNAGNQQGAVAYFRAGADLGDTESMVSLAGYLLEGRFVPRDEREAIHLLAAAEQQGHPAAIRAMNEFREQQRMNALGVAIFARVLGEIARQKR